MRKLHEVGGPPPTSAGWRSPAERDRGGGRDPREPPPPNVAEACKARADEAREANNALAFKQTAVSTAERPVLPEQQLLQAEADAQGQRADQGAAGARRRPRQADRRMAAPREARGEAAFKGDALYDALTEGTGWQPHALTSSAVAIRYGAPEPAFELRAAICRTTPPAARRARS